MIRYLLAAVLAATPAAAGDARSAAELEAALSTASAGTTITLAPADYGVLKLTNRDFGGVTITGGTFRGLSLTGISGLTLDGVTLEYRPARGADPMQIAGWIDKVRDVAIRNSVFRGGIAEGVKASVDGYPSGRGLFIGSSKGVRLEANRFSSWRVTAQFVTSSDIVFAGNEVRDFGEGTNFGGVQNVLIENNYIHDARVPPDGGHPDMIQFWTTGQKVPNADIVIRDNVLDSGRGHFTQSIFMGNEVVAADPSRRDMKHRNVLIEGNVIHNSHLHGISTSGINVTVRNNVILKNPATVPQNTEFGTANALWVPQISAGGEKITISGNVADRWPGFADWFPAPAGAVIRGNRRPSRPDWTRAFQRIKSWQPGTVSGN